MGKILWVVLVVRTFAIPVRRAVTINDMARCTSYSDAISANDDRIKVVIGSSGKRLSRSALALLRYTEKVTYGLALEGNGCAVLELG